LPRDEKKTIGLDGEGPTLERLKKLLVSGHSNRTCLFLPGSWEQKKKHFGGVFFMVFACVLDVFFFFNKEEAQKGLPRCVALFFLSRGPRGGGCRGEKNRGGRRGVRFLQPCFFIFFCGWGTVGKKGNPIRNVGSLYEKALTRGRKKHRYRHRQKRSGGPFVLTFSWGFPNMEGTSGPFFKHQP